MYARLRTRAHKSAAKLQKKIDIHNSVCHFSAIFLRFFLIFCLFQGICQAIMATASACKGVITETVSRCFFG